MKTTIRVYEVIDRVRYMLPYDVFNKLKHLNDRKWRETEKELEIQKRELEFKVEQINETISFLKRVG